MGVSQAFKKARHRSVTAVLGGSHVIRVEASSRGARGHNNVTTDRVAAGLVAGLSLTGGIKAVLAISSIAMPCKGSGGRYLAKPAWR